MKTLTFCTPILTAAVFITTKIRKQPKYQSTDEWMKKMWYMCIQLLGHKKGHPTICDNLAGPWRPYAKWNKLKKKEKQIVWSHMWNVKKRTCRYRK